MNGSGRKPPSGLRVRLAEFIAYSLAGVLALFGTSIYFLFSGKVSPSWLWVVYLFYATMVVVIFHSIFFVAKSIVESQGKQLSKNIPKYLDYAYTFIICAGLFQVFGSVPRVAEYVVWLQGDETYLANKIKTAAAAHLADDCINKGTKRAKWGLFGMGDVEYFYTEEYCATLKQIVEAPDTREYVKNKVLPDHKFINHYIEDSSDVETTRVKQSSITDLAETFRIVHSYSEARGGAASPPANGPVAWIILLLLPLAIAVRLTKTSLELYGNLG